MFLFDISLWSLLLSKGSYRAGRQDGLFMERWKGSDDAVSSTFAFIIAVGIMLGSVGAVYTATQGIASQGVLRETEQVNLQSEAAALKQIILDSPGIITGGGAWDEAGSPSADDLVRLGLLEPDGSGVQLAKLQNLRLAPYAADSSDGYANYDEVRTALGLHDKGLDFHIRTTPTLQSLEDILNDPGLRDPNLKVTYIGNVDSVSTGGAAIDEGLIVNDFVCTASPTDGPSWRISVDITNGGTTTTQFFVVFEIDGGNTLTRQDQTGLVAPGATTTVHVDVENILGFTCDPSTTIDVDIVDPVQLLRSQTLTGPAIGTAPTLTTLLEFHAETGSSYTSVGDTVRVSYYGGASVADGLLLDVRSGTDPSGSLVHSDEDVVSFLAKNRYMDIPGSLSPGEYTAYLTHVPSGVVSTQRILIGPEPDAYSPDLSPGTVYDEDPSVAVEVGFINDLVNQFCPTYYDNMANSPIGADWDARCSDFKSGDPQPGDIFPDLKPDMREMGDRLLWPDGSPRYDIVNTLVVGSNVAHNAMTDQHIGGPIEEWVLGGGTLIVFGSPDQATQWLQSIFHVGQASSSGGISTPDVSHPLLTTPESLSYEDYDTSDKGWKYTGGGEEFFTNVVEQGDTTVTAVSDPGDFGEGTVILTSWRPYDLYGDGGSTSGEGLSMMYNFVMHGYRDLFLDYGPPLPADVPIVPAAGRSFVDHPDLGPITLDFTLYLFPSG